MEKYIDVWNTWHGMAMLNIGAKKSDGTQAAATETPPPPPPPPEPPSPQLVVLDINGLLCRKVEHDAPETEGLERLHLTHYDVELRPGVREFLEWCYGKYDVGFYSSTTYPNCTTILQALLTDEQQAATKFRLYREHTALDPDYGKDPTVRDIDTVKLLGRVLRYPFVNTDRRYHVRNTLICDDSSRKLRFVPEENRVLIPAFAGDPGDKVMACLRSMIAWAFVRLGQLDVPDAPVI